MDSAVLGPRVPALVRAFELTPAGTHRGRTATQMVRDAITDGVTIGDVVVDPGHSLAKPEFFLLPLRREGVHVTFHPASHQRRPKPFNNDAILIEGQLFSAAVPEALRELPMPPIGSDLPTKLIYEAPFNRRAAYRYSLHAGPDEDGTTRWRNPFSAKRLRSSQLPETMRSPRRNPLVTLPEGARPAATVSVAAGDLPLQQNLTAGTTAHSISMGRRNPSETANAALKANFTRIDRGHTRVFGTGKVAFLLAFTLMGQNLYTEASFRRMLKAERERAAGPKTRAKRRVHTYDDVLGPVSVVTIATSGAAGRAPPGSA